ncbi:MAG: hypothetical protein Kow0092_28430 [Deferrisomatales bacterium]
MKRRFLKLLYYILAALFLIQALFFLGVRFGRIGVEEVLTGLNLLAQPPQGPPAALALAAALAAVGAGFLVAALRTRPDPKALVYRRKGETLVIPVQAVAEFVDQLLAQQTGLGEFRTAIRKEGKGIRVTVHATFGREVPVPRQADEIRDVLAGELRRVFELPRCALTFRVRAVRPAEPGPEETHALPEGRAAPAEPSAPPAAPDAPDYAAGQEGRTEPEIYEIMPWKRIQ